MKRKAWQRICALMILMMVAVLAAGAETAENVRRSDRLIAAGLHSVGIRPDGTVVTVGYSRDGVAAVGEWTDVVSVAANSEHTVALRADGTVLATGYNVDGKCDVDGWTDIVAIAAGSFHTVGVKADGTVLAAGFNSYGQCDVADWKLRVPEKGSYAPSAVATPAPDPDGSNPPEATSVPSATPVPTPFETPVPLPIWERVPGYEMPVAEAEVAKGLELKFVGIVSIPSINTKLPVQSTWSYEQLAYTPCRYAGSCYNDGFVIIAHSFNSHFSGIGSLPVGATVTFTDMNGNVFRYAVVEVEILSGDQNEELLNGKHALTLMTCTASSAQRIVVRCERN